MKEEGDKETQAEKHYDGGGEETKSRADTGKFILDQKGRSAIHGKKQPTIHKALGAF